MAIWRGINNCSSIPDTILNENGIVGKEWASVDGNGDIILYTIEGWGHSWPHDGTAGISATDTIWDFMIQHQRIVTSSVNEKGVRVGPQNLRLYPNYPNPFNPSTGIRFLLEKSGHVAVKIYNLYGQEIATLIDGFQTDGMHEITWQPKGLPSGLYFYKIQIGVFSETRKLILQK